ncbi:MAG: SelL-related redox protein, partial [Bacteroidota bacterium]
FLRHFGCTFCREALADLAKIQDQIKDMGIELVFIHMADYKTADDYFNRFAIRSPQHVSDPSCQYYKSFGLTKGSPRQLFGLQSWIRGFDAGVIKGLGIGTQLGDGFQMPGVFAIINGEVKASFIHKLASDRPVYLDLIKDCCSV